MISFRELKDRKLVQWAVTYVAGAWVLLQVADLIGDQFGWPVVWLRSLTVLLAVGLLAVLVLAWYHGEKGEQEVSTLELALLAGILGLAGGGVAWVRASMDPGGVEPESVLTASAAAAEQNSIAVLPFADMSPARDQDYFSDGITEEILNALAQVPGLKVTARTSAFQFKELAVDVREVARQLGVAHVLEGSVQRSGERVRITAKLVDARNGYQLWSQRYDRNLRDVFAVQDEIAQAIVRALEVRLPGRNGVRLVKEYTVDPEAHRLYLQGRAANHVTGTSLRVAIEFYRRAIERDPDYAQAWSGLAFAYENLPRYAGEAPEPWSGLARAAARRAIELDPTLAEPHGTLGDLYVAEGQLEAAEREYRRALKLNPGWARGHSRLAMLRFRQARYHEALPEIEWAHELDPLSTRTRALVGMILFSAGRPDTAISVFREVITMDPGHFFAYAQLAAALAYVGRNEEAVAEARRALEIAGPDITATDLARIGYALGRAGEVRLARQMAADLERRVEAGETDPGAFAPAMVYAGLGEASRALDWLERGVDHAHFGRPEYLLFDSLRGQPRYRALLAKLDSS